jgi:hypothetical protein
MGKKSCMRNVIVSVFVTLDNVLEDPDRHLWEVVWNPQMVIQV